MKNIRRTLAYKICGYLVYLLVPIAIACAVNSMQNALMWKELVFISKFFINLMFIPIIILPLFIFFLLFTNNKSENSEFSVIADIGFFIIIILCVIDLCSLCSMFLYGIAVLFRA